MSPHTKVSRLVTAKDLGVVYRDAKIMRELCCVKRGMYLSGYAVAHSQIEDKDPLAFFVTNAGEIFINPKIINRTKYQIFKEEGCLSFPGKRMIKVGRSHKVEVEVQLISDGKLTDPIVMRFSGENAQVLQHECQHFGGSYLFLIEEYEKPAVSGLRPEDGNKTD